MFVCVFWFTYCKTRASRNLFVDGTGVLLDVVADEVPDGLLVPIAFIATT